MNAPATQIRRVGGYFAKETSHCEEFVAKENMPLTYSVALKEPVSGFLQSLFDSGNRHEAKVFAEIVAAGGSGVRELTENRKEDGTRTSEGRAQLERDTFDAVVDPNVNVILGGRFGVVFEQLLSDFRDDGVGEYDKGRISQPDVVVVERDGTNITLVAVDVKDHKVLSGNTKPRVRDVSALACLSEVTNENLSGSFKTDDTMQLSHYYRHFQTMGLAGKPQGAIIGREMVAIWCELDEPGSRGALSALDSYDKWLTRGREVAVNAAAREADKSVTALTKPELSTYCGECPWRGVCDDELVAHPGGGHITLLPGVTPLRAKAHYASGVDSIRSLARLDYEQALALESGGEVTDKDVQAYVGSGVKDLSKYILQARATVAGKVARTIGTDFVNLRRADVEFDFDLENSDGPVRETEGDVHHGSQLVYLWGTRQATRTRKRDGSVVVSVKVKQFSDFTDTSQGEAEAFAGFWHYMISSRKAAHAKGKTWVSYHYTAHELSWMRKLAGRYEGVDGVPTVDEVDAFIEGNDVVDLYKVLTSELIWPTRSNSIKYLAKWARFSWRASDAGGDNSMLWYAKACEGGNAKQRADFKRKVLNYNVDDVAAQLHIREWITSLDNAESPKDRIPLATALRRPRA